MTNHTPNEFLLTNLPQNETLLTNINWFHDLPPFCIRKPENKGEERRPRGRPPGRNPDTVSYHRRVHKDDIAKLDALLEKCRKTRKTKQGK